MNNTLLAHWQAPSKVSAFSTCKTLVLDKTNQEHRQALIKTLNLPNEPIWLEQTHSRECIKVDETNNRNADAAITTRPNQVLSLLTADCLPILITNKQGDEIAAIHAGWRGLCNGIIQNTLKQMNTAPAHLMAWIGPAICGKCYAVGPEVYSEFKNAYPFAAQFFEKISTEKWLANLAGIAQEILTHALVEAIYPSEACTFEQDDLYYSYRRGEQTSRIATFIWFTQ